MNSRAAAYRFLIASFTLTALLVITAVTVFIASRSVEKSAYFIKWDAVPGSIAANVIRSAVMRSYEYAVNALSAPDAADRDARLRDMLAQEEKIKTALVTYRVTMLINPELDAANIRHFESLLALYATERTGFVDLVKTGRQPEALRFLDQRMTPAYRAVLDACDDVVHYNNGNAARLATDISTDAVRLRQTMFVTVSLAVICGLFVALNLWSRHKEEQELAQQRQRFTLALRAAGAVSYVRDFRSGAIEWSDQSDRIITLGKDHLPRTIEDWLTTVHPEDQSRVRTAFEMSQRKHAPYELEYRMTQPGGAIAWLRDAGASSAELGPDGIMFGIVRDITERKRAQEETARLETQLRQSQKMEAIGTMAGGIAHDFNNSLTAIIGNADMLLEDMRAAGAGAHHQESMETVLHAGRRASELVRQILTFSRQTSRDLQPLALTPIAHEVFRLLRSTAPASIEMAQELSDDVPLVEGDATQLYQVIVNLCNNGVHAMKGTHGRLELRLDTVMADVDFLKLHAGLRPGPQVRLSVSDTGHGMDAATLKRIFEPFFTTKAPGEGTGLGLAVVHGIVKEHGGGIFCYSRPGEGTVFHVYFPAITREGSAAHPAGGQQAIPQGHGEKILLVDDDLATRRTAAAMLTRLGYKVQDHGSPEEALNVFRPNAAVFDLVVTDLAMPNMTGLEFSAAVLRIRPAMPIMLVTGFAGNLTAQSLREIGIGKLLLKPLTRETLGPAIQEVLSHPALSSPTDVNRG